MLALKYNVTGVERPAQLWNGCRVPCLVGEAKQRHKRKQLAAQAREYFGQPEAEASEWAAWGSAGFEVLSD
jgi:hypothetical protein